MYVFWCILKIHFIEHKALGVFFPLSTNALVIFLLLIKNIPLFPPKCIFFNFSQMPHYFDVSCLVITIF